MNEELSTTQIPRAGESSPSFLRKAFFVLCIIVLLCLILFLIYQNGKSIYDNGI